MTLLPGISGTLFPSQFLSTLLERGAQDLGMDDELERQRRRFIAWWKSVDAECGPATGLRALFDLVGMPLASLLGFRARNAEFESGRVHVDLFAPNRRVALVLLPWAVRPSGLWRDLTARDRTNRGDWCLLLAPPFVSVVDLRGHALRRSADFQLPAALDSRSFAAFWTICRGARLDDLVLRANHFQDTVREDLQVGVVRALSSIGPILQTVRPRDSTARFDEALTIVYRILFLLFAESRDLVPSDHPSLAAAYTVTGLCRDALRSNTGVRGLWDGLAAVTRLSRMGCDTKDLIVRPFNGQLFSRAAAPGLERCRRSGRSDRAGKRRDSALALSLIELATRPGRAGREEISYADLGVEQLGAVYERVLDLDPDTIVNPAIASPDLNAQSFKEHSRRRKDSGTFYTPQPLAEFVVRRTLAPLVRGATADEILSLRVVDPAMGSGAFLVAACRFLSHAYERALIDEGRCAETDFDVEMRSEIRRKVAGHCLAGVDANPVAVQLARLSLWLTTLARDRPLSFLDHHLRVGDSLVGTTPEGLWRDPVKGRRTTNDRQGSLLETADLDAAVREVVGPLIALRAGRDDSVSDVRARERLWNAVTADRSPVAAWRKACDVWCARWFWPGQDGPSPAETRALIAAVVRGDRTLGERAIRARLDIARAIAQERRFFHWPLEFADVFYEQSGALRARPGFDAVIGNPPWDLVRTDRSTLVSFVRESGQFIGCQRGRLNLYQPFIEQALKLARRGGRIGLVLPWSAATDDGAADLRKELLDRTSIDTIVGLDNARGIFPIHRGLRFLVLGASVGGRTSEMRARFGVQSATEIEALPDEDADSGDHRPIGLTRETLRQVGGPLLRIPDVRRFDDLERIRRLSRALPALGDPAGWSVRFGRELNATEDSSLFGDEGLPVIDGKHISSFRVHLTNTNRHIRPTDALEALPDRRFERARLAYRDVSGVGNRQALIAAIVPADVLTTHTLFCLKTSLPLEQQHFLCGLFNSRELDTFVRMLMGSHVTTSLIEQLPAPLWTGDAGQLEISRLAEALSKTQQDSQTATTLAQELDRLVTTIYDRAVA